MSHKTTISPLAAMAVIALSIFSNQLARAQGATESQMSRCLGVCYDVRQRCIQARDRTRLPQCEASFRNCSGTCQAQAGRAAH